MVPRALVKRYASELKESIETIAKCMENERINQLEKSGKIAVIVIFVKVIFKIII